MQQSDHSEAARRLVRRLVMAVVIAAGLTVLILPACRTGPSAASIATSSPAAIAAAHRSAPGGGCADRAGDRVESCRDGAPTGTASAVQTSAAQISPAQAAALSPVARSSVPTPGTSMLACITVLMVVLAAISQLRLHRSTAAAAADNRGAPLLSTRGARPVTLAELCVLRT